MNRFRFSPTPSSTLSPTGKFLLPLALFGALSAGCIVQSADTEEDRDQALEESGEARIVDVEVDQDRETDDREADRDRDEDWREDRRERAEREDDRDDDRGLLDRWFGPETKDVVVPAGTVVQVSLSDTLSSHDTPTGAGFSATVTDPVVADGVVVIPAGARLDGVVTEAMPAKKIGGRARLSLDFVSLDLGEREVPIDASLSQVGKSQRAKDAAIIGGSTIAGAILGDEVDGSGGGVIGAIVGGLAGTAAAKKTDGKPIVLGAGTDLGIRLESPIRVTVELDT